MSLGAAYSKWDRLEVSSSEDEGAEQDRAGLGRDLLSGGAPERAQAPSPAAAAQQPWLLDPSLAPLPTGVRTGGFARGASAAADPRVSPPRAERGGTVADVDRPDDLPWNGDCDYDDEEHGPAQGAVVFLHNAGDTPGSCRAQLNNHFVWRGEFEAALAAARVRVHYPAAPLRRCALAGGAETTAWFDVSHRAPDVAREDSASCDAAAAAVAAAVDDVSARHGVARENILVGGFDQGGTAALHYVAAFATEPNNRVGGAFVLCGALSAHSRVFARVRGDAPPNADAEAGASAAFAAATGRAPPPGTTAQRIADARIAAIDEAAQLAEARARARVAREANGAEVSPRLPPLLFVYGGADGIVEPSWVERTAARLRELTRADADIRTRRLDELGHEFQSLAAVPATASAFGASTDADADTADADAADAADPAENGDETDDGVGKVGFPDADDDAALAHVAVHDALVPWIIERCGASDGGARAPAAARVREHETPVDAARDPDRLLSQMTSVPCRLLPPPPGTPAWSRPPRTAVFDVPPGSEALICRHGVMCRGASFGLTPGRVSGTVETTFESTTPEKTADAIAERLARRLNDPDAAGVEECCVS